MWVSFCGSSTAIVAGSSYNVSCVEILDFHLNLLISAQNYPFKFHRKKTTRSLASSTVGYTRRGRETQKDGEPPPHTKSQILPFLPQSKNKPLLLSGSWIKYLVFEFMANEWSNDNEPTDTLGCTGVVTQIIKPINILKILFVLPIHAYVCYPWLLFLPSLTSPVHGWFPLMSESVVVFVINLTSRRHVQATYTILFWWYDRSPAALLFGRAKLSLKALLSLENYIVSLGLDILMKHRMFL